MQQFQQELILGKAVIKQRQETVVNNSNKLRIFFKQFLCFDVNTNAKYDKYHDKFRPFKLLLKFLLQYQLFQLSSLCRQSRTLFFSPVGLKLWLQNKQHYKQEFEYVHRSPVNILQFQMLEKIDSRKGRYTQDDLQALFQTLKGSIKVLRIRQVQLQRTLAQVQQQQKPLVEQLRKQSLLKQQFSMLLEQAQKKCQNQTILLQQNQDTLHRLRKESKNKIQTLSQKIDDLKSEIRKVDAQNELLIKKGKSLVSQIWGEHSKYGKLKKGFQKIADVLRNNPSQNQ